MERSGRKRRGRPRRDADARTLPTLSFRAAPETRALVEQAAEKAGHSLSAEIDRRLQQSFWDKDRHQAGRERVFGGRHNFNLAFLLARVATGVEHSCGASWPDDPRVWREVATAIVAVLQLMRGLKGGEFDRPLRDDGMPDPRWDVAHLSATGHRGVGNDPHWVHALRLIDVILSNKVPLHWPLVATIKRAHDDSRDEIMPTPEELRDLYARTGLQSEPIRGN